MRENYEVRCREWRSFFNILCRFLTKIIVFRAGREEEIPEDSLRFGAGSFIQTKTNYFLSIYFFTASAKAAQALSVNGWVKPAPGTGWEDSFTTTILAAGLM